MKKTIIVGNIGNAAECREVKGGHKFISFSVAYDEKIIKDDAGNVVKNQNGDSEKKALWVECEIYVKPDTSADGLLKLLAKGRHIYIEANEKAEAWINKETGTAMAKIVYKVQTFEV